MKHCSPEELPDERLLDPAHLDGEEGADPAERGPHLLDVRLRLGVHDVRVLRRPHQLPHRVVLPQQQREHLTHQLLALDLRLRPPPLIAFRHWIDRDKLIFVEFST